MQQLITRVEVNLLKKENKKLEKKVALLQELLGAKNVDQSLLTQNAELARRLLAEEEISNRLAAELDRLTGEKG